MSCISKMVTTAQHCTLPLQTSVNASMDDLDNGTMLGLSLTDTGQ